MAGKERDAAIDSRQVAIGILLGSVIRSYHPSYPEVHDRVLEWDCFWMLAGLL